MTKSPVSSPSDNPQAGDGGRDSSRSDDTIRREVMASLGRPPQLSDVAVRPLWLNYYRVNVLVGVDPTALRVAHSYFVEVGDGGRIRKATPPITRVYA